MLFSHAGPCSLLPNRVQFQVALAVHSLRLLPKHVVLRAMWCSVRRHVCRHVPQSLVLHSCRAVKSWRLVHSIGSLHLCLVSFHSCSVHLEEQSNDLFAIAL
jgi:hypothetical protein